MEEVRNTWIVAVAENRLSLEVMLVMAQLPLNVFKTGVELVSLLLLRLFKLRSCIACHSRASLRCLTEAVVRALEYIRREARAMRVPATNRILEVYYVSVKRFAAVTCNLRLLRADARLRLCHVPG